MYCCCFNIYLIIKIKKIKHIFNNNRYICYKLRLEIEHVDKWVLGIKTNKRRVKSQTFSFHFSDNIHMGAGGGKPKEKLGRKEK